MFSKLQLGLSGGLGTAPKPYRGGRPGCRSWRCAAIARMHTSKPEPAMNMTLSIAPLVSLLAGMLVPDSAPA